MSRGGEISSGEWRLSGEPGLRFLRFRQRLIALSGNNDIDAVFFEEVKFGSSGWKATQMYGGFKALLLVWCRTHSIPCRGFSVQAVKKYVSGDGGASKQKVINSVKILGHSPGSDNEADALALLYLGLGDHKSIKISASSPSRGIHGPT